MFTIGKSLIGMYIGGAKVAESYGAAGSLIVILVWIYYSTLIFLFGADLTRPFAEQHGSHAGERPSEAAVESKPVNGASDRTSRAEHDKGPVVPALPDVLEQQTAITRAEMGETWQSIRDRL